LKNDDSPNRRTATVPNNGEVRREVTPPAVNRNRSFESPGAEQRPATRERSVPDDIQRNSPELNRNVAPARKSATIDNNREIRREVTPPAVNRSRSFESRDVQRSAPRSTPSVEQRSAPRSSGSPNVQQRSSSRSSGSPSVEQRSGATRSSEGRRGRQ